MEKGKFNKTFVPVTIPIGNGTDYSGIVNLIEEKAYAMPDGGKESAGDIPENALATLMHANFDRLVNGASDAASMVGTVGGGGLPTLALAISCVGRRLVLGEGAEEEIEATLDVLPPNTRQVGFYSYGEISPHTSGHCDLHNQTMTLTTIAEV